MSWWGVPLILCQVSIPAGKLSASLSGVVVNAELPASGSCSLLSGGQHALHQHWDPCVKTVTDETPHCFSSAFCFWNFPDISWTVRLLCVATAERGAWRSLATLTSEAARLGARIFPDLVPIDRQVSIWGLQCLAGGPRDGMRKGPMGWTVSFLGSYVVPWLRSSALEPGTWLRLPALSATGTGIDSLPWSFSVTLGSFHNLSVFHSSHLWSGKNSSTYFRGVLWKSNELLFLKCL